MMAKPFDKSVRISARQNFQLAMKRLSPKERPWQANAADVNRTAAEPAAGQLSGPNASNVSAMVSGH